MTPPLLRQLGLPGTLPEQPSLAEPSCSLILCPETGPDTDYWARVKNRREWARVTFERTLEAWSDGQLRLADEAAQRWWPGTGVSSQNHP